MQKRFDFFFFFWVLLSTSEVQRDSQSKRQSGCIFQRTSLCCRQPRASNRILQELFSWKSFLRWHRRSDNLCAVHACAQQIKRKPATGGSRRAQRSSAGLQQQHRARAPQQGRWVSVLALWTAGHARWVSHQQDRGARTRSCCQGWRWRWGEGSSCCPWGR